MHYDSDIEKTDTFEMPCEACGSQMLYSAEKKMLQCTHCKSTRAFSKANCQVQELSFRAMAQGVPAYKAPEEKRLVDCGACGAKLMIDASEPIANCNFCGSKKINEKAFDENVIPPQGIIPFQVPKNKAINAFQNWIGTGFFAPSELKKVANLGQLNGVYIPFFTFDIDTYTRWSGDAGKYYYEGEGEDRERKVRWTYRKGSFKKYFDDFLIMASTGMPNELIRAVYPFQLNQLINFNSKLLLGWKAEIYTKDFQMSYSEAKQLINSELRAKAKSELGGDTQRNFDCDIDLDPETYKHLLLPLWICNYSYQGKPYTFVINGQTGKIHGDKPTSWLKVFLVVVLVVAIIAGLVYFFSEK